MISYIYRVRARSPCGDVVFDSSTMEYAALYSLFLMALAKLDEFSGIATLSVNLTGVNQFSFFRYECRSCHCDLEPSIKW